MENNKLFSKSIFVWLIAGFCCLLWGSAFPGIKIGYELFNINSSDTFTIIMFAGIRFFLAGFLTFAIFSFVYKHPILPNKKSLGSITVLSLFQTVFQYVFFYLGLAYTSGENASVIQGTNVFFAILISSLLFKMEKLTFYKILGCVVGFIGVVLVSINNISSVSSSDLIGEVMILFSTLSYSFSSVFMKKFSVNNQPAMLSAWQFMLGGAIMVVVGIIGGGKLSVITVNGITLLIYLALVSSVAYSLWSILLMYNPVSKVAVCGFLTPIFGFILSSLFSNSDNGGLVAIFALIFVVIGIVCVNKSNVKKLS